MEAAQGIQAEARNPVEESQVRNQAALPAGTLAEVVQTQLGDSPLDHHIQPAKAVVSAVIQ